MGFLLYFLIFFSAGILNRIFTSNIFKILLRIVRNFIQYRAWVKTTLFLYYFYLFFIYYIIMYYIYNRLTFVILYIAIHLQFPQPRFMLLPCTIILVFWGLSNIFEIIFTFVNISLLTPKRSWIQIWFIFVHIKCFFATCKCTYSWLTISLFTNININLWYLLLRLFFWFIWNFRRGVWLIWAI